MEELQQENRSSRFSVVGIGASAGGITALQTLLESIPAEIELAFVVVQHLLPDHPSQLARLLGTWTSLPVCEAVEGDRLAPGHVYVAPPGLRLGIADGAFTTEPLRGDGARAGIETIDAFFDSLAENLGERAIAVVLSGTGSDGAAGAVRIKQRGGLVLVQDPHTAMHDGMPGAAIANGAADHIMPLAAIARELVSCASPDYVRSASSPIWAEDVTGALDGMIALVRAKAGFDLAGYKATPLVWRIQRRMEIRRVPIFRDYEALLHDDPRELEALIRAIPIHVTSFFRDPSVWMLLERNVVPVLLEDAQGTPLRAWTPACSTGEEAYSLAMLLAEQTEPGGGDRASDFQLFATDASSHIVARAGRGVFSASSMSTVSDERRQRFFYAADGAFRVKRSLREKMIFAPQHLLTDPPLAGLDLVTCRNLLIYLDKDAARHVIRLLNSSLRTGGVLVLGASEGLTSNLHGFEEVAAGSRIYRKVGGASETDGAVPRRLARADLTNIEPPDDEHPEYAKHDRDRDHDHDHDRDRDRDERPDSSEALRLSHAELESSREEMQALNEELLASNDQLNVANQDLNSANTQLREKVRELETQSDVLSSGAVMSLFLDEELRIRFYTPAVWELFPIRATDLGRRITDLVPRFEHVDFVEHVRAVMRTGHPSEAEVRTSDDRWYLKRIRPFRTGLGHAAGSGVAINFTDITDRKRGDEALRRSEAALATELEAMTQLHAFSSAATDARDIDELLGIALDSLMRAQGADMGHLQLYDPGTASLRIAAHRGFEPWFLEEFAQVDASESSVWARAMARRERVCFSEVESPAGFRAVQSTPLTTAAGGPLGMISTHFRKPRTLTDAECRVADILANELASAIARITAAQLLGRTQAWLTAQNEAFRAAMNDAPLETSLRILVDAAMGQAERARCAFFIADEDGRSLRHVVGLRDDAPDRGEYGDAWSLPVETSAGKLVGSFAMYFAEPRRPTARDRELAASLTQTAAIIISRHPQLGGDG
ncbi:MAG TPA: chemotaxis protein CheB [Kofleriaceae bacterium]|nr:chemotaxis protein CheB [Kofleriaceae bacterium]